MYRFTHGITYRRLHSAIKLSHLFGISIFLSRHSTVYAKQTGIFWNADCLFDYELSTSFCIGKYDGVSVWTLDMNYSHVFPNEQFDQRTLFAGGYGSGSRAGGHNRDKAVLCPCCGRIIFNLWLYWIGDSRDCFMAGGWSYARIGIIVAIALADNHSACIVQIVLELVAGDTVGFLLLTIAFVVSGAFLDEPILFLIEFLEYEVQHDVQFVVHYFGHVVFL